MFNYKGISTQDKSWVKGDGIVKTKENIYICYDNQYNDDLFLSPKNILIPIIEETLCIGFGKFDKNGKEIYTNDIMLLPYKNDIIKVIPTFSNNQFGLINFEENLNWGKQHFWNIFMWNSLEVIGNKFDEKYF